MRAVDCGARGAALGAQCLCRLRLWRHTQCALWFSSQTQKLGRLRASTSTSWCQLVPTQLANHCIRANLGIQANQPSQRANSLIGLGARRRFHPGIQALADHPGNASLSIPRYYRPPSNLKACRKHGMEWSKGKGEPIQPDQHGASLALSLIHI